MKRLTTDAPKNNLESALNLFYAKDGEAWVLGGGPEPNYVDVTLFDYIRSAILNNLGPTMSNIGDDELKEVISESWIFDGNLTVEGLIATLYTAAWAFAELRELPEDDSRYTRLIERNQEEYHKLKEENEALRSYYDGLKQAHALACAQLDMVRLIFGGNR